MGETHGADCHSDAVLNSLMEFEAVKHHIATARAALTAAKAAPIAYHRDLWMCSVMDETATAKARLSALAQGVPGLRARCHERMREVDAIIAEAHAWAATLQAEPAKVIDFPSRRSQQRPAPLTRQRRAKKAPPVNKNLHAVADETPAAC